jgi:hypothetical protein
MQIPASCWSVQERNRRRFWTFAFPFCPTSLPLSVAKPGVSKWELRGRVREGVSSPAGDPGAVPPEKFSSYRCMQVSFSAFFRQKSTH